MRTVPGPATVPVMPLTEQEREAFRVTLDAAVRERDELDGLIGVLSRRLGIEPPPATSGSAPSSANIPRPDADPSSLVSDGEFFGMSATKATKALLGKLGRTRPLKTQEIFLAITKGGVALSNIEVLYKSLSRSDDFLRVAKGTWGLAEWYSERIRKTARSEQRDELDEIPAADTGDEGDTGVEGG